MEKPEGTREDTLCVLPFVHFNLLPNGQASVCCASTAPLLAEDGSTLNIRTHTLQQIWNSNALRDVRLQMLSGERPHQCADCYHNEKRFGGRSHRTQQNALFLVGSMDDLRRAQVNFDGFPKISRDQLQETTGKPWYFDLRFDNLCNLKCVICYGYASSQIERDPVHLKWTGESAIERVPNRFENSPNWVESGILFDELKEISTDVRYIQLAGGEPFLSHLALRWLDHLSKTDRAKDISMMIYTNFQRFDDKIIEYLAQFKRVYLHLSIDAVGPTYEYVRFPGKWAKIEKNAERLAAETGGRLSNTVVSINATISVACAMSVCDVFDFGRKHGFNVNLNNASFPEYVSTKFLPQAAKSKLADRLRKYSDAHPEFRQLSGQIEQWITEFYSVDPSSSAHAESLRNVMRFLNDMDKSRRLSFRDTQPELYNDFVSELGYWLPENRFFGGDETWSLGTLVKDAIMIDGVRYAVVSRDGGSVESAQETPDGYRLTGWAADQRANLPARAIIAVVGDDVVARTVPVTKRPDIEAGIGSGIKPAGFMMVVRRRGNKPAASEPIKVFALASDNCAVQLRSTAISGVPLDHHQLFEIPSQAKM